MFAALCDKLFDLDPSGGIVGQLVTDWTVSDDGLEITLKLRPGVIVPRRHAVQRRGGEVQHRARR